MIHLSTKLTKIGAVHIDLDIYEPTVSAFKFIDKCEWDELYFRFDDWHGHEPDYDHHERKAFREWLDKHGYRFEIYEMVLVVVLRYGKTELQS